MEEREKERRCLYIISTHFKNTQQLNFSLCGNVCGADDSCLQEQNHLYNKRMYSFPFEKSLGFLTFIQPCYETIFSPKKINPHNFSNAATEKQGFSTYISTNNPQSRPVSYANCRYEGFSPTPIASELFSFSAICYINRFQQLYENEYPR